MKLLIDADSVVYAAGFAAEQRYYRGVVERPDGEIEEFYVKSGDEHRLYMESLPPDYKIVSKEREAVAEPVSHALYNTDKQISGIYSALNERGVSDSEILPTILLTGPGNFRDDLATTRPYKGNRDPAHKPVHYQAIRNHLTRVYGAIVVHGREADDETSILASQALRDNAPYCVATIDKDLDQIPGLHYDYRNKVFYDISESEARKAFWIQVLAGDAGDNVPGCFGISRAKASRILAPLMSLSDEQLWDEIVWQYVQSTRRPQCQYGPTDAEAMALETAQLVYMQKNPGEMWYPDGVRIQKDAGGGFDD